MGNNRPIVHVVDDNSDSAKLIALILEPLEFDARTYASAEEFLERATQVWNTDAPQCLLLDIIMPGLGGLGLLQYLHDQGRDLTTIVLSGVGEVGIVVKAMKLGAFDYIEKPLHRQILIDRIGEALNDDALKKISHARDFEVRERMSLLSDREREVCKLLVDGKSSKEVSNTLQICVPTVTKHRISIFEKLGVENIVELVRLVAAAENSSRNTIHA